MASSGGGAKTWIPVDVKIHWFSFLGAPDLARCSRVCRSWVSLAQKTTDAVITTTIAARPPQLSRAGRLRFLHRLHNATAKENMGYLIAWAAGSRGACDARHPQLRPAAPWHGCVPGGRGQAGTRGGLPSRGRTVAATGCA
jgi:hypothetical protein